MKAEKRSWQPPEFVSREQCVKDTEEIPGQVCDVLQPPVEKLQGQLKQLEDEVQQHVHQLVSDFAGQLVLIERQVVKQVIRLTESIAASQGARHSCCLACRPGYGHRRLM